MTISQEYYLTYKLNSKYHQIALDFASQQDKPQKAKKVYLNTLAVCATKDFIEELSFETILDKSYSWNPAIRCFDDVADIVVSELGRLECLSVTENTDFVSIPKEVREGRIAYIVVRFPEVLNEVELLGFYRCVDRTINKEAIQIEELEPIENLIDYLFDLELELDSEREPIEIGTNLLASNDEVAIRVRQRLGSESYEEITRKFFRDFYENGVEEDIRTEGARFFKNLMGIRENDLVALDRSGAVDDDDLDLELEELTEDLLDKFKELWTVTKWSIVDRLKNLTSQGIDRANTKIDELAEQVGWLWVDIQASSATRAIPKNLRQETPNGYKRKLLTIAGEQYELRIKPIDLDRNIWTFELRSADTAGMIPPGFKFRLLDEKGQDFANNERVAKEGQKALVFENVEFKTGEGVIWEIEPTPDNYQREIICF